MRGRSTRAATLISLVLMSAATGAVAEPVVPGFSVTVYASVTDPMNMTFAPDGTLYIGRDNIGSGGDYGDPAKVSKIPVGGGTAQEFGSAIPDPDAVLFDATGLISGVPGSVLVGGTGGLFAISPSGMVSTIYDAATLNGDIDDMQVDSAGRLLMISGLDTVKVTTGGSLDVLVNVVTSTPVSMAIDTADRIFLGGLSGTVSIYDELGALIEADILTGLGANPRVRFGEGGAFGASLYVMTNDGDLFALDADGSESLIGSGFAPGTVGTAGSWIAFGTDGALYVAEFPNDRVLRVAPLATAPEPATFALAALGLAGLGLVRRSKRPIS